VPTIKELMGHADTQTTMHYVTISGEQMDDDPNRVWATGGPALLKTPAHPILRRRYLATPAKDDRAARVPRGPAPALAAGDIARCVVGLRADGFSHFVGLARLYLDRRAGADSSHVVGSSEACCTTLPGPVAAYRRARRERADAAH
jgi:hypothetical protein